jgi:suppressor of ftsI
MKRFVKALVVLGIACAWLASCAGRAAGPVNVAPPVLPPAAPSFNPDLSDLQEPPIVHSINGVARLSLIAVTNPTNILPTFAYNGFVGTIPTISVAPGDTIVVDLIDDLPQAPSSYGMAFDMNLHFHGLGVSPRRPSDDVLTMLAEPGGSLHYVVRIPKGQEPGLYWYHPHVHGEVNYQVGEGGMSGALVIDGLEHHLPALSKMTQRIIIVRQPGPNDNDAIPRHRVANPTPCTFKDPFLTTLNGAVRPMISIAPGERQFFRVINATGHKTLRLAVDGEQLQLVAVDGFALDSYPGTPATMTESSILVPPAGRAEFIVTGPRSGRTRLRTLCFNSGLAGDPDPELVLADLRAPKHRANDNAFEGSPVAVGSPLPRNGYTTALPSVSARRTVVLSENSSGTQFFINGKMFRPDAPPMFVVHVGTVEEWLVENVTEEVHDFHIHQVHFLVWKINGVKVPHPYWADSVVVPHVISGTSPGSLVLLMDFRDPVIKGEFVFHCHILDHEDRGMMAKILAI